MVDLNGRFKDGCGKASSNCNQYTKIFNTQMFGTFNIQTNLNLTNYKPTFETLNGYHKYYLVKLNDLYYGWAIRWGGTKQNVGLLEILSKEKFPEAIKNSLIKIEILEPLEINKIKEWSSSIKWFQSFPWSPQRADSKLIWDTINHIDWSGKKVLDIGCNYGYFSFIASKAGAIVKGYDKNKNVIPIARLINDSIEMQDVQFSSQDYLEKFDIIFYFSVQHQWDENYNQLDLKLKELKTRAKEKIFLELIVPDLRRTKTEEEIDKIVGGILLLKYQHKVRQVRKIYEL